MHNISTNMTTETKTETVTVTKTETETETKGKLNTYGLAAPPRDSSRIRSSAGEDEAEIISSGNSAKLEGSSLGDFELSAASNSRQNSSSGRENLAQVTLRENLEALDDL